MTEPLILELEEVKPAAQPANAAALAVPDNSPAGMMLAALNQGADLDKLERFLDLQAQYEAREARKAYHVAFAAFKAEAVTILKNKSVNDGPLKGKSYAELFSVVNAVTPALSKHGLSASWKITRDEPTWMEVTCTLTHSQGHSESVSMGGPPDDGGAKNKIQARASTKTYLERYTLKAICGVAEGGEDDDGQGAARSLLDTWIDLANAADTEQALGKVNKDGAAAFTKAKDVEGYRQFAAEVARRRRELKGAN